MEMAHYKGKYGNSGIIMGENYPASSQPPYSPPQCTYQFVTSTSPPRAIPRAFEFFDFWRSNSRPPLSKSRSNAPHVRPAGWANAPPPGHFFRRLTGQDRRFKTIRLSTRWSFSN